LQIRAGVATPLLRLFGLKQHQRATIKLLTVSETKGRTICRSLRIAGLKAGNAVLANKAIRYSRHVTRKIQGPVPTDRQMCNLDMAGGNRPCDTGQLPQCSSALAALAFRFGSGRAAVRAADVNDLRWSCRWLRSVLQDNGDVWNRWLLRWDR